MTSNKKLGSGVKRMSPEVVKRIEEFLTNEDVLICDSDIGSSVMDIGAMLVVAIMLKQNDLGLMEHFIQHIIQIDDQTEKMAPVIKMLNELEDLEVTDETQAAMASLTTVLKNDDFKKSVAAAKATRDALLSDKESEKSVH